MYLNSPNGAETIKWFITIKVKIFDIEKETDLYIVEKDDFEDFMILIDILKSFKLIQNEKLGNSQNKIYRKIRKGR